MLRPFVDPKSSVTAPRNLLQALFLQKVEGRDLPDTVHGLDAQVGLVLVLALVDVSPVTIEPDTFQTQRAAAIEESQKRTASGRRIIAKDRWEGFAPAPLPEGAGVRSWRERTSFTGMPRATSPRDSGCDWYSVRLPDRIEPGDL